MQTEGTIKYLKLLMLFFALICGQLFIASNAVLAQTSGVVSSCEPSVLQVLGDSIEFDIHLDFPPEFVNKNDKFLVVPTLVSASAQYPLDSLLIGGVKSNSTIKINSRIGGKVIQTVKVKYREEYKNVSLNVNLLYLKKSGRLSREIEIENIAKGTITTLKNVELKFDLIASPSEPEPIEVTKSLKIYVKPNGQIDLNSKLNRESLEGQEFEDLQQLIGKGYNVDEIKVEILWPPEGDLVTIDSIITSVSKTSIALLSEIIGPFVNKISKDAVSISSKASDRSVFLEELQKLPCEVISPDDVNLVRRVIEMFSDAASAQEEIENMIKTYSVLDTVLERMHHIDYQFTLKLPVPPKDSIRKLYESQLLIFPSEWKLYAAENSLPGIDTALIFQCGLYEFNWKALNALGIMDRENSDSSLYYLLNSLNASSYALDKEPPIVLNNLGVVYAKKEDWTNAISYLTRISIPNSSLNYVPDYNLALVYYLNGEYHSARSTGRCGYMIALASLALDDPDSALKALECVENKNSNEHYLTAIVHSRIRNEDLMIQALKLAIEEEPSLKEKARNDLEFLPFRDSSIFQQLVKP